VHADETGWAYRPRQCLAVGVFTSKNVTIYAIRYSSRQRRAGRTFGETLTVCSLWMALNSYDVLEYGRGNATLICYGGSRRMIARPRTRPWLSTWPLSSDRARRHGFGEPS